MAISLHVHGDLFYFNGQNYLLVVDFFPKFIEIVKLSSTSSREVISQLNVIMSRMGFCDTLVTDGGPQYSSDLANLYGIRHIVSSPRYPVEFLPVKGPYKLKNKCLKRVWIHMLLC